MRLIKVAQGFSTGRIVAVLFLLCMAVYLSILFFSIPRVVAAAPELKLFDVSPAGYTTDYAHSLLDSIGEEGRRAYRSVQLPLDTVYPGLFILAYGSLFVWVLKRNFAPESKVYCAAVLPVLAGLFDWTENGLILLMLNQHPNLDPRVVAVASSVTVVKSVLSSLFFFVLILSVLHAAWRAAFRRKREPR